MCQEKPVDISQPTHKNRETLFTRRVRLVCFMFYTVFDSAYGTCAIVYRDKDDAGIVRILLPDSKRDIVSRIEAEYPDSLEAYSPKVHRLIKDILRYFDGELVSFSMDLLDMSVCYPLQHRVLMAERTIPRGKTASYGWVAKKIDTKGIRAVGSALARNPFPLVVPCHRAVRSDGRLGGFQGGLGMKRALLEMEGVKFDSTGRVLPRFIMSSNPEIGPMRTGLHFSETSWLL